MSATIEDRGLGRLVDVPDPRDYLAAERVLRALPTVGPARIDWSARLGPVLDQGQTPSCVAHGLATVKTFYERRDHRRTYRWQPHELYRRCKLRDGIPHAPGTYPRVALDLLVQEGIGRDRKDYDADAGRFRIVSYQRLLTVEEIERALVLGPCVIGIDWAVNWTWRTRGVLPEPTGWAGGHLITIAGCSRPDRLFKLRQSWGEDAHDGGNVHIPYAEVARQLALPAHLNADAWAVVDEEH